MYVHRRIDPNERFRERRRRSMRRARIRRAAIAAALVACAAGIALGASFVAGGGSPAKQPQAVTAASPAAPAVPGEIRGVHVSMYLAGLPGKLSEYYAMRGYGLNTIELDVKDENGAIGFSSPDVPRLARTVGAARSHYDEISAAQAADDAGVYLIGRVVAFADPILPTARPDLALQWPNGTPWHDPAGFGWLNPYDRRAWKYVADVAVAAAKAGFDEIQFDYVRFPSDGDLKSIVYPHRRNEPKARTIERFIAYASKRLRPHGVHVSADLFGLAATRDLGVGQAPAKLGRHLDAIYPMVYPSHYVPGEYHLTDPEAFPGRTVSESVADFQRQLRTSGARIVPWVQDFSLRRRYGLDEVMDQVEAARRRKTAGFMLWNPLGVYTREALAPR